jgi:HSP20 family molecular chaperone IbpA
LWKDEFDELREYIMKRIREIEEEADRAFTQPIEEEYATPSIREPLHTIYEKENEYIVVVDIPWADESKIIVNAENNVLEIKARLKKKLRATDIGYRFFSEETGEYYKRIILPEDANVSQLKYRVWKNRLVIEIPKIRRKEKKLSGSLTR